MKAKSYLLFFITFIVSYTIIELLLFGAIINIALIIRVVFTGLLALAILAVYKRIRR